MNDALDGRRPGRTIDHFVAWFGVIVVIVAIALFASGRSPDAVGELLGLLPIGAIAVHFKRRVREVTFPIPRPTGIWIMAATTAMPGVILLFVTNLIGGTYLMILGSACGTWMIGSSALIFTVFSSMSPR